MTISGWNSRYLEILQEFGYSKFEDSESAKQLSLILKNNYPLKNLRKLNIILFLILIIQLPPKHIKNIIWRFSGENLSR